MGWGWYQIGSLIHIRVVYTKPFGASLPAGYTLRMSRDLNPKSGDAVLQVTFDQDAEKTESHVLDMKKAGWSFVPSAGEGHYRVSLTLEGGSEDVTREIVEFNVVPAVHAITGVAAVAVLVVAALTLLAVLLSR